MSDIPTDRIDRFVRDWLTDTQVPGASLAIVDGEDIRYANGYGVVDADGGEAATPETLYGIGSVTKSFTALAVLQLVDQGEVALDDEVTAYVPCDGPHFEGVTLAALLTHSSGMPSFGVSEVLISRTVGDSGSGLPLGDREDFYAHLAAGEEYCDDAADGRFLYNNSGYTLLSHVVEAVDGRQFRTYVDEEILAPLGMERSRFTYPESGDRARPHKLTDEGPEPTEHPERDLSEGPGGLLSSATELGRYLQYHLAGDLEDGTLVESDLLAQAHSAHVETPSRYGEGYGYGWIVDSLDDERYVEHGGSILVSTAAAGFLPEADLGIALLANAGPDPHPSAIARGILAILRDREPTAVSPGLAYRERVSAYEGEYVDSSGGIEATVRDAGGVLEVTLEIGDDEPQYTLVPTDNSLEDPTFEAWATPGYPAPAEFVPYGDGMDLFLDRYRLRKTDN